MESGGLRRSAPLKRSSGLRRRSAKTARLYREQRVPLVRELLGDGVPCERCLSAVATDVHEIKSRARGGPITDRENLAALCRPCHSWVTEHPADAHAEGWLKHGWE